MKKLIHTLFLLLIATGGFAEEIVLSGIYQGKNLYVMNPFAADGNGFCITGITVNGVATSDEINASAFEIDLTKHNLTKGDNVSVESSTKAAAHQRSSTPRC